MKKLCIYVVLVLVVSALTVVPTGCYDSDQFSLIEAYWGINQKTEVSPGDVATLTVVLKYVSYYSLNTLEAHLLLPNGYEPIGGGDTVIIYHTGAISQGSLVTLEFPIFITPDTEIGSYIANLSLLYYSRSIEEGDELQIPFEVTGKPIINANILNDSLYEGQQQILIKLSNDGDAIAKYLKLLKVSSSNALVESFDTKHLGNLEPGGYSIVPLSLFVPTEMIGKILSLNIEASCLGPKNKVYSISETLQTRVEETEEDEVKISTEYPEVTIEAGNAVQYPTKIINLGDTDKLLSLFVETPTNWKGVFLSGTLEVSKLHLEAGQSESLVVKITPPKTVDTGTYVIHVQVISENGTIYANMELKTTIVGSYSLRIESSTLLTSITAGGSTSFTVEVTNTGQSSVMGVNLNFEVPTDWDSSISPTKVDVLGSSESSTFSVVIKAPGDAVTGDYMVTLTGLSDEVESSQVQVRFTVTTSTEWGLYGFGVVAIFIVALVLVFLKFKRR